MAKKSHYKALWSFVRGHYLWGVVIVFLPLATAFSPKVSSALCWICIIISALSLIAIGFGAILHSKAILPKFGIVILFVLLFLLDIIFGIYLTTPESQGPSQNISSVASPQISPTSPKANELSQIQLDRPDILEEASREIKKSQRITEQIEHSIISPNRTANRMKPISSSTPATSKPIDLKPSLNITQNNVIGHNVINSGSGSITVNDPNAWSVQYFPNGMRRKSRGGTIMIVDGEQAVASKILALNKTKDWKQLVQVCEAEIKAVPEWLTPYFYAGWAYANLGQDKNGIERLEHVVAIAEGDPDWKSQYDDAKNLLKVLQDRANN